MSEAPSKLTAAQVDERLAELRKGIDSVDAQIVELLSRRAGFVQKVGELKHNADAPVYRPEREAQIMTKLRALNPGPIPDAGIESIYREIVSVCRELERRMKVAYLGPAGTFSEQALIRQFGSSVDPVPCGSFDEIFRATEARGVDFGIVPIENSSEGSVNRSADLMLDSPLQICGEVSVPVRHSLMTRSGSMQGVTRICAHPQALAQCTGWLDRNHPGVERIPVSSNAEGARLASIEDHTAGIAGELAASRYGLQVVSAGIQDDPLNRTRFVVVGYYECGPSGNDKTSVILSVPDRAGAVYSLIEPLARHGVSMKRFESRPARQGTWEYYFYIDLIGHRTDAPLAAALAELRERAAFFKLVGSYPRAD